MRRLSRTLGRPRGRGRGGSGPRAAGPCRRARGDGRPRGHGGVPAHPEDLPGRGRHHRRGRARRRPEDPVPGDDQRPRPRAGPPARGGARTTAATGSTSTTARASRCSRSGSTSTPPCPRRRRSGSWPTSSTRSTASACRSSTSSAGAHPSWSSDGITAAMDVGPSDVGGTTCEHYAFRQEEIDWQIWIQMGDHPLPRKLVITTKTDEARPQHTAVYTWNLAPSYNDPAFEFDPPAGRRQGPARRGQAVPVTASRRLDMNRTQPTFRS